MGEANYMIFVVSICGFNALWNFIIPFIFNTVGDIEKKGEIITIAIAMQMTGLGFEPLVAALILGEGAGFFEIQVTAIGLLLFGFILLGVAKLNKNRLLFEEVSEAAN